MNGAIAVGDICGKAIDCFLGGLVSAAGGHALDCCQDILIEGGDLSGAWEDERLDEEKGKEAFHDGTGDCYLRPRDSRCDGIEGGMVRVPHFGQERAGMLRPGLRKTCQEGVSWLETWSWELPSPVRMLFQMDLLRAISTFSRVVSQRGQVKVGGGGWDDMEGTREVVSAREPASFREAFQRRKRRWWRELLERNRFPDEVRERYEKWTNY